MPERPAPTIRPTDVVWVECPHCQAPTANVIAGGVCGDDYEFAGTCLQCIADGGTCCTLSKFNRWAKPEGAEDA